MMDLSQLPDQKMDLSGLPDKKMDLSGLPDKRSLNLSDLPDKPSGGLMDLSGLPDQPKIAEPVAEIRGPEKRPPIMNQMKVYGLLEGMPAELAAQLKKSSLEYDKISEYGEISYPELSLPKTIVTAVKNIPDNVKDIVRDISSVIMYAGKEAGGWMYGMGKDVFGDLNKTFAYEYERSQNPEAQLPEYETFKRLENIPGMAKSLKGFVKKMPEDIAKAVVGEIDEAKNMGEKRYLYGMIEKHPVDILLVANAVRAAVGGAAKLTLKGTKKIIGNGTKFSKGVDEILSTKRTPLVLEMPVEYSPPKLVGGLPKGQQKGSKIVESATKKTFEFSRQYSKDPLTKYMYQKSFDAVLKKYPKVHAALAEHKAGKVLIDLRKTYDSANVQERIKMHKLIDEQLSTLSPEELKVMVPYLEGRASLIGKPSEQFDKFEDWYRGTMKSAESDFMERGILSPERVDELIYDPLMKTTGKTFDEVKAEFGDFTPAYVHQMHTKYPKKMSVEFADTTGKRAKVGVLKRRKIGVGYSENLRESLPKWASEYVRFKNTEAFLNEFTTKFGVKTNIKNVKQVEGGLQVGDEVYRGYKIIAPDGILRFYKGKVDFYKEVSKKLDELDFDEAIGTVIKESVGDVRETSRVISGVEDTLTKQGKMIEDRVREALTSRGFATGESEQMITRIKSSGIEGIKTIVNEKEYTKIREIITTKGVDPDSIKGVFSGMSKEYVGVAKNQTVYLVPEKIAANLESWATPFLGSQKAHNVKKLVYDKPIGLWKDMVLAAAPRWVKNNVMGDILFNTMEGVGPLSYGRGFSAKYTNLIPDELLKASFAETMKYNPKLGLAGKGTIGGLAKRVGESSIVKGASKVKDVAYGVNTAFEQPFVRSLYVKEARDLAKNLLRKNNQTVNQSSILYKMEEIKNSSILNAPLIKKVKETLPVFDLSGNLERKYMKGIMPFYNWYKFMAIYGAKLPGKHPFKTVGARGLGALSEIEREQAFSVMFPFMKDEIEQNGIPNRYDHLWPIEYPDENNEAKFFNSRGMNPFSTLVDFSEGDFVNLLSPVIKMALERSLGENLFKNREFEDAEQGRGEFKEFDKVKPPWHEHVLRQFPQYELLKQALTPAQQWDSGTIFNPEPKLDSVTGEYKYPINSLEKLMNYVGVDKKTLDIKKTWLQFQEAKQRAINETFKKDQSKYSKYVTFDELVGLFKYIKSDEQQWRDIMTQINTNKKLRVEQRLKEVKKIKGK